MPTVTIRPDRDITTAWSTSGYVNIDDVVNEPSTGGDATAVIADDTDDGELETYGFGTANLTSSATIQEIRVWTRGNVSALITDPITHELFVDGGATSLGVYTENYERDASNHWKTHTYSGLSLSGELLSDVRISNTAPVSISKIQGVSIYVIYVEIDYIEEVGVAGVQYTTVQDMIDHLLDYSGAGEVGDSKGVRDSRRAILMAYRDLDNAHQWSYYFTQGRILTVAEQTSGTMSYDHEGGTDAAGDTRLRLVTFSGTAPTWSGEATIRIANVDYEVDDYIDSQNITLTENSNPGADVASTTYVLYRDKYQLPANFLNMDIAYHHISNSDLQHLSPRDFLLKRRTTRRSGTPKFFTVVGDEDEGGRLLLRLLPYPSSAAEAGELDFYFKRRPRRLLYDSYDKNFCTTTMNSTTITGTSTNEWTAEMEGSVIRIAPTNQAATEVAATTNANPFARMHMTGQFLYEHLIMKRNSGSDIIVDAAVPEALTNVRYTISDPIDVEGGAMLTAFQRCAEMHMAIIRHQDTMTTARELYKEALQLAVTADKRSAAMRPEPSGTPIHGRQGSTPETSDGNI